MGLFRSLAGFVAAASACAALTSPPLTDYVTYLGGSSTDNVSGIAVDSAGSEYIAGTTNSPNFPVTSTALGTPSAAGCAFVTKLNPAGTGIVFSICVANYQAVAFGMDAAGNLYLTVNQQTTEGPNSSYVLKLDPAGQNILYTTGIEAAAAVESMAVDSAGDVYLTGSAVAGLATTKGAYQPQLSPGSCVVGNGMAPCADAFVLKLSPTGALVWATYLGGAGPDDGHAIAVDSTGSPWVVGQTASSNFPVTAGALDKSYGGTTTFGPVTFGDGFVAKFDPTGGKLLYSTYLGGSEPDAAFAVAIDADDSAYVTGGTSSSNFPVTAGALQTNYLGNPNQEPDIAGDAFVTKFASSGDVVYSTFVGGQGSEGTAIAVDASGDAAIDAAAASSVAQATACTGQPAVTVLSADGSAVAGSSSVTADYLVSDSSGGLYSAGTTTTLAFLSTPNAYQVFYGGGSSDGYAGKVDFLQPAAPALSAVVNAATLLGGYRFPYTGALAPGEIVALFGNGFGSKPAVSFSGLPAPILYASNCQINAVVPFGVAPGTPTGVGPFSTASTPVTVVAESQTLGPLRLGVVTAVPGIFTLTGTGTGQAAVINQNGTINSASNPAPRGSIIAVYMTGTGQLTPAIADGSYGPSTAPFPTPVASISAWIGDNSAPVLFAGQAPTLIAGVTQVNVQIPPDAPTGAAVGVTIEAGGYSSGGQVVVAVQ